MAQKPNSETKILTQNNRYTHNNMKQTTDKQQQQQHENNMVCVSIVCLQWCAIGEQDVIDADKIPL